MDPASPKTQSGPTLLRNVGSPVSINTEIVNDIPVKNPLGSAKTQPLNSPVAQVFQPTKKPPANSDDPELDHILKDVNASVKRSENTIEAKLEHLSGVRKKVAIKKAKLDENRQGSPPIVATVVAALVALLLTVAAFYIYRKGY